VIADISHVLRRLFRADNRHFIFGIPRKKHIQQVVRTETAVVGTADEPLLLCPRMFRSRLYPRVALSDNAVCQDRLGLADAHTGDATRTTEAFSRARKLNSDFSAAVEARSVLASGIR
jgi:hypothetical protein